MLKHSHRRVFVSLFICAFLLLTPSFLSPVSPAIAATSVFINEIHYDNTGTDSGEAIEIAGPAGTNLSGWSLVLYNGAGGVTYSTTALSGVIPDQASGFGTLSFSYPVNGIQNGAPDGMALVDPSNIVQQFLSYEGTFAATNGPANGMTSISIGVSEIGNEPAGLSLQLTGSGTAYESFTWTGPVASSFGAVNTGQAFMIPPPLINEFSASHAGTDNYEYVEIFGTPSTDFSSYTILHIEGDSTTAGTIDSAWAVGSTDAAGFWTTGFLTNAIENGSITLLLVSGFIGAVGNDIDTNNDGVIDVTPWTAIVDDVGVSDGGATDRVYSSSTLTALYDGLAFAPGGASRIPNGADTNTTADWVRNDFDLFGIPGFAGTLIAGEAVNTPGAVNTTSPPPTWLINEFLADPGATTGEANGDGTVNVSQDEFVEIINVSSAAVDITGWTLSDSVGVRHTFPSGTVIPANCGIVVFGGGTPTGTFGNMTVHAASSGQLGLNNGGDTITLSDGVTTPATVTYGSEGGNDQSLTRDPDITGASFVQHAVATGSGGALFSPGTTISGGQFSGCAAISACGTPGTTLIHDIQGSGASSPIEGNTVIVEAIVTGDYQESAPRPEVSGFYIQEEDASIDADPATSEGIYVYDPGKTLEVAVGDLVRFTAEVDEYSGITELKNIGGVEICSSGNTVTPTTIDLPVPDSYPTIDAFYETLEGMLVTFADTLTVTELYDQAQYGQLLLSEGGKLWQYSQVAALPLNTTEYSAYMDDVARRSIILDDFNLQQNIDPVYFPQPGGLSVTNYIRAGATVSLTGILEYRFNAWQVQPLKASPPVFTNPSRPTAAPAPTGNIRVASFNVLNYFNGDGAGGGFPTSRGADSVAELSRQTEKIAAAMIQIDADVFGLIEIENDPDGPQGAPSTLVNALNAIAGAGTYSYVMTGAVGTDEIKQAIIYKTASVTPLGAPAVLDTPAFVDPLGSGSDRNRPAIAQTFQVDASPNDVFTLVVIHLKSKGSDCGGAPDDDPIQGNCNQTRTAAATVLANWLATDPTNTAAVTGSADQDFIIMGDFNAYYQEDPMQALASAGISSMVSQSEYSYVFDGLWGTLDNALGTASMRSQVTSALPYHINADENPLLDYNDTIRDASEAAYEAKPPTNPLYAPDEFRSSDHDPIIVDLVLAPYVLSTDPADASIIDATNHDVMITFSKPVTVPESAFTLSCNLSGAHTVALSGGPETYALTPHPAFIPGDVCSVTVTGSLVVGSDAGTSGVTMLDDYAFTFSIRNVGQPSAFDPALSKSGSPYEAAIGEPVVWTIVVTNPHDYAIDAVFVNDPIANMFDITGVATTQGTATVNGQVVTVNIGSMAPAQQVIIQISTVGNASARVGEICNTALSGQSEITGCVMMGPGTLPDTGDEPIRHVKWLFITGAVTLVLLILILMRRRRVYYY